MIRNAIRWPNGARCAIAITFDMDADSLVHIENPARALDLVSVTSMLRYGPEVGVPRILASYRKLGIRQTFFVPAWCASRYPNAVESMIRDGHEVALHSYIHERSNDRNRDEEDDLLHKSLEILESVAGSRPVGWRAPMYSFSRNSAELLVRANFLYDSSLMGDDIPYLLETSNGCLVELPVHWGADDYPHFAHMPELGYAMPVKAPRDGIANYRDEFEAHYAHGGMWIAVWHPFLTGRLARWHHIEKFLMEIRERDDVWFATLGEIARHVITCREDGSYRPRVDRLPYYDMPVPLVPSRAGSAAAER